eukprot:365025-Chlamydomonas_euryale.AAC.6
MRCREEERRSTPPPFPRHSWVHVAAAAVSTHCLLVEQLPQPHMTRCTDSQRAKLKSGAESVDAASNLAEDTSQNFSAVASAGACGLL